MDEEMVCSAAAGSAALEKARAFVSGAVVREELPRSPSAPRSRSAGSSWVPLVGHPLRPRTAAPSSPTTARRSAARALDSEVRAVDEVLEWSEARLAPAVRALEAAFGGDVVVTRKSPTGLDEFSMMYSLMNTKDGGPTAEQAAAVEEVGALLATVEAALEKKDSAYGKSIAALVVGVDVRRALKAFPAGAFPRTEALADLKRAEAAQVLGGLRVEAWTFDSAVESMYCHVERLFEAAIAAAFPGAAANMLEGRQVMRCAIATFGDYQCNSPMAISKALKAYGENNTTKRSPRDVGEAICRSVPPNDVIASCSVAPAGFINCRVRDDAVAAFARDVARSGAVAPPNVARFGGRRKVLVDFSSPNIAKEMHVGHLRSTIIGDTICNVAEFCGHDVSRVNHVGDWGTQFGMLIAHMAECYPNFLTDPPNITDLTEFYKAAKRHFDESEEFKTLARQTVVALQAGDARCRQVWALLCDISRKEFDKVYARLGVTLVEVGESFYNDKIPGAIALMDAAGLVQVNEGASCVFMPSHSFPLIVRKSDGGFGYDSTDCAALHHRFMTLKQDWVVYVTDMGQQEHFHLCFEAAKAVGWVKDDAKLKHVGFGLVQGIDGKRFKTRSGDTVRLVDLLDEAVVRMEASLRARVEEGRCALGEEELKRAAASLGYGAVKYFDLHQHPATNYKFSYDKMLSTSGNTAIYLLFAHARLASIVRKASEMKHVDVRALAEAQPLDLAHPKERALAFELAQFVDVVETVSLDFSPVRLCDYLYKLSNTLTAFITECYVIGDPREAPRLVLCEATALVMRKCFNLLGINAPMRV